MFSEYTVVDPKTVMFALPDDTVEQTERVILSCEDSSWCKSIPAEAFGSGDDAAAARTRLIDADALTRYLVDWERDLEKESEMNGYQIGSYTYSIAKKATIRALNAMLTHLKLMPTAKLPYWRKTAENPPTEKDAAKQCGSVLTVQNGAGFVTAWHWTVVADFPEDFPVWMPMPEMPKEEKK